VGFRKSKDIDISKDSTEPPLILDILTVSFNRDSDQRGKEYSYIIQKNMKLQLSKQLLLRPRMLKLVFNFNNDRKRIIS